MGGPNVKIIQNTAEWKETLANAGAKAVVVDFFAEWCGPCKTIAPKFSDLADQLHDSIIFLKVDVDQCEEIAKICNITAMPTFQVWKDNQQVDTLVGANLDKLIAMVNKYK